MPPDGFLNVLKPPGMTSHDVVAFVRARLGARRVGHLGTLDPAAAGVLPVAVGRAARLFRFAGGMDKAYRAEIVFGVTTDTLDAEGRVTGASGSGDLTEAGVRQRLPEFAGEIEQVPPAFSAAQVGGTRLYELARAEQQTDSQPRRVRISRLDLVEFTPGARARALVDTVCSSGTYVRVLAADLGRALGCGAYLGFLVRTRVGRFEQSEALSLEEIEEAVQAGGLEAALAPLDWPLDHLAGVEVDARAARRFCHGGQVLTEAAPCPWARVYGPGRRFLGLGEVVAARQLRPQVVLATEEGCDT